MISHALELSLADQKISLSNVAMFTAEIFESIYGTSLYYMNFNTTDVDRWEKIANNGGVSKGKVRWGYATSTHPYTWSKWKDIKLQQLRIQMKGTTVGVSIRAVDATFELKKTAPRAVFKQKTVAEMVEKIAGDHKLTKDIDEVSPTKRDLCQCGMNDYEFIHDELIPLSGKDPVLFYVKDGHTLVFKLKKKGKPVLMFKYDKEQTEKDVGFHTFETIVTINASNFGVEAVAFDPLKKESAPFLKEFMANDDTYGPKGDPLARISPEPLSVNGQPAQIQSIAIKELGISIQEELENRVSWDPGIAMHKTLVPTHLVPQVEIGTIVRLEGVSVATGEELSCTGDHLVYAVYHRMFPGGDTGTTVFLERRGTV